MTDPANIPAAGGTPSENERTWGMVAHLAALFGLVMPLVGNWLGPLVIWLTRRDQSTWVAGQAKEALNFNITTTIAFLVCTALTAIFVGFILAVVVFVAWLALTLIAVIKASEGVQYRYPLTLRLVK